MPSCYPHQFVSVENFRYWLLVILLSLSGHVTRIVYLQGGGGTKDIGNPLQAAQSQLVQEVLGAGQGHQTVLSNEEPEEAKVD